MMFLLYAWRDAVAKWYDRIWPDAPARARIDALMHKTMEGESLNQADRDCAAELRRLHHRRMTTLERWTCDFVVGDDI